METCVSRFLKSSFMVSAAIIFLFNNDDVCHYVGMSMDCFMHWTLVEPTFVSCGFNLGEERSVL
jgi:hypothetical protein